MHHVRIAECYPFDLLLAKTTTQVAGPKTNVIVNVYTLHTHEGAGAVTGQ